MPKSKAELMKRLRDKRVAQGLVEFKAWMKPKTKEALKKLLAKLEK